MVHFKRSQRSWERHITARHLREKLILSMHAYRGHEGKAPHILHFVTRWRCMISIMLRQSKPREKVLYPSDRLNGSQSLSAHLYRNKNPCLFIQPVAGYYRMSHKPGTTSNIGVLTQLYKTCLTWPPFIDTNAQTFLPVQENGANCLRYNLTAYSDNLLLKMPHTVYFQV
jgi:hypothetical protein